MAENFRRCVATGESGEAEFMIRFVVGPDGALVPDPARKLPGRGLWLTATRQALERALSKRAFARAARQNVVVDGIRADRLEAILAARSCEVLGLARKAGQVTVGFEKVRALLGVQGVGCLISAADGAADGKRKLHGLARDIPRVEVLSSEELSLALGRENVVHAALSRGRLCKRFLAETRRLAGFRVSDDFPAPGGLER